MRADFDGRPSAQLRSKGQLQQMDDKNKSTPTVPGSTLSEAQLREVNFHKSPGESLIIPCCVNGVKTQAVIDTAAQVSIISVELLAQMRRPLVSLEKVLLRGAGKGSSMTADRFEDVPLTIGGQPYRWNLLAAPITDSFILGLDFLRDKKGKIDLAENILTLGNQQLQAIQIKRTDGECYSVSRITLDRKVVVPPYSMVKTSTKFSAVPGKDYMVNAVANDHKGLLIPNSIVSSKTDRKSCSYIPVILRNESDRYVHLKKGHFVGCAEEVDEIVTTADKQPDVVPDPNPIHLDVNSDRVRQIEEVPIHLQDLWKRSCEHLTDDQAKTLAKVLIEYQDIFSTTDTDLGKFSEIKHKIDTGDARSVRQKMRRTAFNFEAEEKDHLEGLLKAEVIEPSASDWASPPVLVRKKDGKVRYCIDFRMLNDRTAKDAFPLPNIEECLDVLEGTEFFSTLDMCSGYYQIEIEEEDKHKTAFITRYGLFQYRRMPFGLCNAPATFQRAMTLVLRGLTWEEVLAYLDDIIILGNNFDQSLTRLRTVFDRFRQYNLKLKAKKCALFQKKVLFLGKMVSKDGVAPNPDSVEKVKKWPVPSSAKDVERFLGLANYHRSHIKNFAEIASPLYAPTKKGVDFSWIVDHDVAFAKLKEALVTSPVLAFPKMDDGPFILDTDASDMAIGAELQQIQDGQERLISYGSYSLTPSQRNYCTTKKELLAVVRFTRQFRHYLLGKQFYVRTDHGSLAWLMRFKLLNGMLARWIEELSQYDMIILHRKGIHHSNADALSRIPEEPKPCNCYRAGVGLSDLPCGGCSTCTRIHHEWSRFEEDIDDVVPLSVRQVSVMKSSQSLLIESTGQVVRQIQMIPGDDQENAFKYSHDELREKQLQDPDVGKLLRWKEGIVSPSQSELQLSSPFVKFFWMNQTLLKVVSGILYYKWFEDHQSRLLFVVPAALQGEVLQLCHDSKMAGHPGQHRTYAKLLQSVIWYGMRGDCATYVKSCPQCNRQKKPSRKAKASLGKFHAGAPIERIHLDILGPFTPSSSGNQYVLMLVDQFTKWIEAYPLRDQRTETMATVVIDNFISRFGCPTQIHTDQGRNFTSNLFHAICELLEITKTRTTPYRPCSNGQVERYNSTLLQIIRCYLNEEIAEWDKDLHVLTGAIRALPNRQTGFTPNMMMFGREVLQPVDLMYGLSGSSVDSISAEPSYVKNLRERLHKVHSLARAKIGVAQQYQKKYYDSTLRQIPYEEGDVVLKLNKATKTGQPSKLQPIWKGPFLVTSVISPLLCQIRDRRRSSVVHHDMLKKCTDRCLPLWLRRMRSTLTGESEEMDESETDNVGIATLFDGEPEDSSNAVLPTVDEERLSEEDIPVDQSQPESTWIQCERPHCLKWRLIPTEEADAYEGISWFCSDNKSPQYNDCSKPEQDSEEWVDLLDDQGFTYTVTDSSPTTTAPVSTAPTRRSSRQRNKLIRFREM